ncbi:hypothetical protein [Streptococcus agalactiae]|uniref:hypothetical protein n=1 Tax=Streptococcus agalactiae TaxID=1311 RepID=UPI003F13CF82
MINLTLEGEHELLSALKKEVTFENKRKAVRKNGRKLHKKAVKNANFNGHYKKEKARNMYLLNLQELLEGLLN